MKKPNPSSNNIEKQIIAHNLRLTTPRKIIAQVLEGATDHPDVAEIHARAYAVDKSISVATVYRTLNLLYKIGALTRHEFSLDNSKDKTGNSKGRWRFEPSIEGKHYHLIDVETGKIIEFESPQLDKLQETIAKKHGYQLHSQTIELYGIPQKNKSKRARS